MTWRHMTIFFLLAALIYCQPAKKPAVTSGKTTVKKGNYYEVLDLKNFESQATQTAQLERGTVASAISLLEAPQRIQCNLPWAAARVLYVTVRDEAGFQIERHLIQGREFFFDQRNAQLKLQFLLPAIYFVNNQITFRVDAYGLDGQNRPMVLDDLHISFHWQPTKTGPAQTGLSYLDLRLAKAHQVPAAVRQLWRRELTQSNQERWHPAIRARVKKLVR